MDAIRKSLLSTVFVAVLNVTGCAPSEPAELSGNQVVVGDSYTTGLEDNGEDPDVWPPMLRNSLRNNGYELAPTVSGRVAPATPNPDTAVRISAARPRPSAPPPN